MAPCVRFLQCAGCRFDSPSWDGPDEWITQRNKDLWQTFEVALSMCQAEKVDFLFLTGDLFEQEYVRKETVERVAKSLAMLKNTKVFITPGERDPLVMTSAYRLAVWPNNVHIFSGGISSVIIPSRNVTIYGAGWTAYHQEATFLERFELTRDGTIPIMLLHAELKSIKNTEGFIPILPEHIASSGLAYLALGHREEWSGLQKAGETVWTDSGFLEARSFCESGPHGVIMGEVEQDTVRIEFRELGKRHYIEKSFAIQTPEVLISKLLSETSPEERQRDLFRVKLEGPVRNVESVVLQLQKLLADKLRFVEVVLSEGETNSRFKLDFDTPLKPMAGNGYGYPTLNEILINKLEERQISELSSENSRYWELVMRIGLAALAQGRNDDEN